MDFEEIVFTCQHCTHNALMEFYQDNIYTNIFVLEIEIKRCYKAIRLMEERKMILQEELKKESPEKLENLQTPQTKGEPQ